MGRQWGRPLARHWILAVPFLAGLVLRLASRDGVSGAAAAGLLAVVATYVACVRWGCWRWLAAVATLPAALDDRMLVAQSARPDWALVLTSLGVVALSWGGRHAPRPALAAGAVLTVAGGLLAVGSDLLPADPGVAHLHLDRPVTSALAVLGLLAAFGVGRADPVDLRLACVVPVALGAAYGLQEVAWWPVAGALGVTAMLRGRRGRGTRTPQHDPVDDVALEEFRGRYGRPALGPVVVVIAAYDEADGIPAVLANLPTELGGLATDVVVVDDGSTDGTAAALENGRAHVVACGTNRGQGAALRLGYRVAREHGAAYVVTTDADGQYAVADLPTVLTPVLEGRADFVTGSRILGRQQTRDRVRRNGVHVFAWLATVLTGRRSTDTSFGLRAMRAEVTGAVTLNQPQYQSSELLLGVLSHGFRVLEVPATMNLRSAGSTKKGRNLVYGRRYARAMIGTWLREGLPRPVPETAPALRHTREHGD
ncbi:MAG TPA: glycosyltransferase family 2 protein [Nocardioides sp.]|nr:glycosyltransferase family 2 protein [Nocardioides sp.]